MIISFSQKALQLAYGILLRSQKNEAGATALKEVGRKVRKRNRRFGVRG